MREVLMENREGSPAPQAPPPGKRIMTSEELFGGANEVIIRHAGEEYRLRVTKNDKLILTK
jgi:hemin uptake protein HemP